MSKHICCVCGIRFKGLGNNPWPVSVDPSERCCDRCNQEAVIPARIKLFAERNARSQ